MVWSWCMLKANHEDTKFPFNGEDIIVKKGQFITGRDKATKELPPQVSSQKWRTAIEYLKSTSRITIVSNNKFSIISIVNWTQYQIDNRQTNQPLTNEQPTINQPLTTYKNDKKVKNDKKIPASQDDALIPVVIDLFKEVNPSFQRLFGMPPQRAAAQRMVKQYGLERLSSMIAFLPKSNSSKFAPTITTPVQFEQKIGELVAWSQKQKDVKKTKVAF